MHLAADRDPLGREAESGGEPAAVLDHRSRSSSVKTPRLRPSKGASLTPPTRVENAAVAPGSSPRASASRLASRHSIAAPRRLERRVQLLLAPGDLAVELAPQRLLEAAADRRALRDPGRDQLLAVDLERDVAPLGQVAVEPLGAQRPGQDQLDRIAARRPARPPRRGARAAPAASASSPPAGPSAAASRARSRGAEPLQGPAAEQPGDRGGQLDAALAQLDQAPLGRAGRSARGASASPASRSSSASRRSAETAPRSASRSSAAVSGSSSKPKRAA